MKQKDLLRSAVDFKLTVKDSLGFDLAQVCSGGVATDEINPSTLESRLHRGLYLQGNFLILTEHAEAITFSGHGPAEPWPESTEQRSLYDTDQPAEASDQSYGSRPETED